MAKKQSTRSKTSTGSKPLSTGQSKTAAKTVKKVKTAAKPSSNKSSTSSKKTVSLKKTTVKKVTGKSVKAAVPAEARSARPAASKTKARTPRVADTAKLKGSASSDTSSGSPFKINFNRHDHHHDREPLTEAQLRKVKTGLTKKDLARFCALLIHKRAEISGDVESLRADAKSASGTISYEHMADTGSDNYEQEFTLGLVETQKQLLDEIDDALQRIEKGIYGVCVETGVPINIERLEAKPWAKYCIEVAREMERRQAPRFRA